MLSHDALQIRPLRSSRARAPHARKSIGAPYLGSPSADFGRTTGELGADAGPGWCGTAIWADGGISAWSACSDNTMSPCTATGIPNTNDSDVTITATFMRSTPAATALPVGYRVRLGFCGLVSNLAQPLIIAA
jgi:hypothetical protein